MNQFTLIIPSKTYILGEYVALHGGPAILLSATPAFRVTLMQTMSSYPFKIPPFHPNSTAYRWLAQHQQLLQGWSMEFYDPHQGQGGFGASGAQFIAAYYLSYVAQLSQTEYLDSTHQPNNRAFLTALMTAYFDTLSTPRGLAPSGYDIVVQNTAMQVFTEQPPTYDLTPQLWSISARSNLSCPVFSITKLKWPFKNLKMQLQRTHNKCDTHTHLENLQPFDTTKLSTQVTQAERALQHNKAKQFIDAIKKYHDILEQNNLVHSDTLNLCRQYAKKTHVLASKGCGALGADVILTINKNIHANNTSDHFTNLHPTFLTASNMKTMNTPLANNYPLKPTVESSLL